MKTIAKVGIGAAIAAAIVLIAKSSKPATDKTAAQKRSALKTSVTETAGAEKAAAVDNMTDEEVNTVMDTLAPTERVVQEETDQTATDSGSGDGGGGGGSMTNNPPAGTTPAPKSGLVFMNIPNATLSPILQSRSQTQVKNLFKKPTPFSMVVTHSAPRRTTVIKRGVGAIDGTDCVSILKKHGIM